MRIGLFVSAAGREDSGPETYEHCLIRELVRLDGDNEYHLICFSPEAVRSFRERGIELATHVLRPSSRWISIPVSLPLALRRLSVDFYHATFIPPMFSYRPLVMTLHGSDMFLHPEFFKPLTRMRLNLLTRRGLAQSSLVICVSRHVRNALVERFHIPEERLAVVHHGVVEAFRPRAGDEARARVRERHGIDRPYVLYVGKMIASKNISRLVQAFRAARRKAGLEIDLVMVGRTYPRMSDLEPGFWKAVESGEVRVLGQIPHAELPWLYAGATLFAFPSLWEGFGLPVLEAMACGCPVMTSDLSCLPEIAGGAARLVDPYDIEDMSEAIATVCADPALRARMRELGLRRAARFSWAETARQVLAAYRRAGMLSP